MATKTYHGSCHCGAVRVRADLDLAAGTGKCSCSFCTKIRNWRVVRVLPHGQDDALVDYQSGTMQGHHLFCRNCDIHPFSRCDVPEIGGALVSVQLASLDDATPLELVAGPVHVSNGRNNDWMHPPAESRHL